MSTIITPTLANIGIPMLIVQMPVLMLTLPVVIAIEAWLCRRWLGVPAEQSWSAATRANLLSTLIGFPILWFLLFVLRTVLLVALGPPPVGERVSEPWLSILFVALQVPWVSPTGNEHWMIPTAGIILLIPSFFMTILMEGWVYRRAFRDIPRHAEVPRVIWRMHYVTYSLLLFIGLALFVLSVNTHTP